MNGKYTILAKVEDRLQNRREITEKILSQRSRNRGILGVSLHTPDRYCVDKFLAYVVDTMYDKNQRLFQKFKVTKRGFYQLLLNDTDPAQVEKFKQENNATSAPDFIGCTSIFLNQPSEFCKIEESNFTYEKMKMLADSSNYFIARGDVRKIPDRCKRR